MKAMILSAGEGRRLRPLTDDLPKPLVEVKGKPLILHQIDSLAANGITDIVINLHYKADKIKKFLGNGNSFGVTIEYSYEEELLNTGGGIAHALPLLGRDDFIVTSADIYTEYNYTKIALQDAYSAHLIFVPNPDYHEKGDYAVTSGVVFDMEPRLTYANIGIFKPELFADIKDRVFPLKDVLHPNIKSKHISGEVYTGVWANIGTVKELENIQ